MPGMGIPSKPGEIIREKEDYFPGNVDDLIFFVYREALRKYWGNRRLFPGKCRLGIEKDRIISALFLKIGVRGVCRSEKHIVYLYRKYLSEHYGRGPL